MVTTHRQVRARVALGYAAAAMLAAMLAQTAWAAKKEEQPPLPAQAKPSVETAQELDETTQRVLGEVREFWQREEVKKRPPPEFPDFTVPARKGELEYFPCMDCHEDDDINIAKIRPLTEEHEDIVLDHGGERFWCLTCHNLRNMDFFRSMKDEPIDFNKPYLLCGQCHSPRQKDWFYGGHGKRIGYWDGPKIVLSCTECHNSHSPSIKPHRPDPPPKRHRGPDGFFENLRQMGVWRALGFSE